MQQGIITALALAIALSCAPLFLDLALAIAGNLFPVRSPRAARRREIRLAVVIPAHDEESLIARTVASVRAAAGPLPVYVVAHNCSDGTAAAAAKAGAQVLELTDPSLRGKGAALRHGFLAALAAEANALLIVDADTTVTPNLVSATKAALENGADATQCRYELELPSRGRGGPMARLRSLAFRGMNVVRPRGRAGLGFSTGLFGNGFAVTAETLERVPFVVNGIAEDIEFHVHLVCAGLRVRWVGEAAVFASLAPAGSAQATQEARWEGGRLNVAARSTGRLLAAVLGGKLRALETLADVGSLPLARGVLGLLVAAALPVHWLHVYALVCAAVALVYVLEAALLGPQPLRDLIALAAAPLYLLWKAAITPLVVRQSRRRAEWERTRRESPQP